MKLRITNRLLSLAASLAYLAGLTALMFCLATALERLGLGMLNQAWYFVYTLAALYGVAKIIDVFC